MNPVADLELVPTEVFENIVSLRRDLHRHPELAWQEERTAGRITEALEKIGITPTRLVGTAVIADLPGLYAGPMVALRAEMDALPVHERTGLEFSSVNEGVMHACGHDGHSSMLVGAASLLAAADPLPVPVRLIFQPAEEAGAGADRLIEAGVLDGVGMIFGGHVDRHYPPGVIVVSEGTVNAATHRFAIEITGKGGHGGRPHESIDAVVVGSLLVTALQTIVSREVDPANPSVVSIGSFHAGHAPNVIAGQARLEGTIRAMDLESGAQLADAVRRIADAVGQLHHAEVVVESHEGLPPLINSPEMAALAREAACEVVGDGRVVPLRTANMGGEDFAEYLEHVPGAYIRYGGQVPGREGFPAHSSRFDFDERALATGAAYLAAVARLAAMRLA